MCHTSLHACARVLMHVQMKSVTPDGKPDNYLLEMELALEANRKGKMAIYPLLVGSEADGVFTPFDGSTFRLDGFPSTASPTSRHAVKATLARLFKFQGIWQKTYMPDAEIIDAIAKWTDDFAWSKKSSTSLKVCWMIGLVLWVTCCS